MHHHHPADRLKKKKKFNIQSFISRLKKKKDLNYQDIIYKINHLSVREVLGWVGRVRARQAPSPGVSHLNHHIGHEGDTKGPSL